MFNVKLKPQKVTNTDEKQSAKKTESCTENEEWFGMEQDIRTRTELSIM